MLLSYELAFKREAEEAWEGELDCPPWGRLSWKQQEMLFFPPRVLSPWNSEAGEWPEPRVWESAVVSVPLCVCGVSQGLPVW